MAKSPVGQALANSPVGQALSKNQAGQAVSKSQAEQAKAEPAAKPKEEKKGLFGRIGEGISNIGNAAKEKLAGAVGNVLEKGKDGVKSLVGKGKEAFEGAKEALGTVLEKGKDGVKSLIGKGAQAAEGMKELFGNVLQKGKDGVKSLVEKGGQAVEGVKEFLGNALEKGKDGVKSLVEKGGQAAEGVKELFGSVLQKGKDGLKSLIGKGAKAAEGVKELFGSALGKAKEAGKGFLGDAKDTFFETLGNIKDTALGSWEDIKTAYDENWGEASKKKEPGEKERTGWDKFWDFTGKLVGTGATFTDRITTDVLAGGAKLASQGLGRGVGMFSQEWGDKINAAGDYVSEGIRTAGNMAADFKRDIVHGAIAGDSVKDPGAGHIVGQVLMGFVPIAGQIADVRDVIGGVAAKDVGRTAMASIGLLPGLGDGLKQLKHADELPGILKYGGKLADGAKGLFNKLPGGVKNVLTGAKEGAGKLWNGAKEGAGKLWNGAKEGAGKLWNGAKEGAGKLWNGAKEGAGKLWNGAKEGAGKLWNGAKEGAGKLWNGAKESGAGKWIGDKAAGVKDWLTSKFTKGTSGLDGLVNETSDDLQSWLLREGVESDRIPMEPEVFQRIKTSFENKGGLFLQDADAQALLNYRGADACTLDVDTVLFKPNPTRSEVFEELIHTSQYKKGIIDGSPQSVVHAEIEAAEKLIRNRGAYKIPDSETLDTIGRAQNLIEDYKKLGMSDTYLSELIDKISEYSAEFGIRIIK